MKQRLLYLLTLFMLLGGGISHASSNIVVLKANSASYSGDATESNITTTTTNTTQNTKSGKIGEDISYTFSKSAFYDDALRIYGSSTITITPSNDAVITNIKIEKNGSYKYNLISLKSGSAGSYDNLKGVWSGSSSDAVIFSLSGQFRANYIEITYTIPDATSAPTELTVNYNGTSIADGGHIAIPTGSSVSWSAIGADSYEAAAVSSDNYITSDGQSMTFDQPGLYLFEVTATNKIGSISQSAEINVVNYNPSEGVEYKLVKSENELAAGDIIVFAATTNNKWYTPSKIDKNDNFSSIQVNISDDKESLTINDNTQLISLEGSTGAWDFKTIGHSTSDGYLNGASGSSNRLTVKDTKDPATIEFAANNSTTIKLKSTRGYLRMNPNNGTPIFNCYSSSNYNSYQPIYIYKQHVTEEVLPEQAVIEHDGVGQFTVTVEPGHYIHYKPVYATMLGDAKSFVQARRAAAAGSALDGDLAVDGKDGWYEHKANTLTLTADPTELAEGQYYVLEAVAHHPLSGKQSLGNAAAVSNTGTTTGIEDVTVDATPADNSIYNLQGQRVSAGYKGIAIVNGKKVILK